MSAIVDVKVRDEFDAVAQSLDTKVPGLINSRSGSIKNVHGLKVGLGQSGLDPVGAGCRHARIDDHRHQPLWRIQAEQIVEKTLDVRLRLKAGNQDAYRALAMVGRCDPAIGGHQGLGLGAEPRCRVGIERCAVSGGSEAIAHPLEQPSTGRLALRLRLGSQPVERLQGGASGAQQVAAQLKCHQAGHWHGDAGPGWIGGSIARGGPQALGFGDQTGLVAVGVVAQAPEPLMGPPGDPNRGGGMAVDQQAANGAIGALAQAGLEAAGNALESRTCSRDHDCTRLVR